MKTSYSKRSSRSHTHRPSSGSFRRGGNGGSRFGKKFAPRGGSRGFSRGRGARKIQTFDPSRFINTNPVETQEVVYTPTHTFSDFAFTERLAHNVARSHMKAPSPIQDQAIKPAMEGRDVIGLAETGTGKTAAFLLPLIHRAHLNPQHQVLILTPTRELALQVNEEFRKLSHGMGLFSTSCVGGMSIHQQISLLRKKNHFIIGTPGRVIDLIERGHIQPSRIHTVVLDEADRMLDMGFINDMRRILEKTPTDRHTLFFSATMSKEIERLVYDFLVNPVTISVKKKEVANSIAQDVVRFESDKKFKTLRELLADPAYARVLVFGSMKHSVQRLADDLVQSGIRAEAIHGNKNHGQRQRALKSFKEGRAQVLVATDVAARGIHVDEVTHVINYDLPNTFEDYVHRIGRTGRGSKRGKALTFIPA